MSVAEQSRNEDKAEAPIPRFSYAFARDKGLLILGRNGTSLQIGKRAGRPETASSKWAGIEARRFAGLPVIFEELPDDIFERRLSEIYSVEGLAAGELEQSSDLDLLSLADGLPKTADLLDSEDDAPVIRLINALIAEAVKTKSSDIHIEPYERDVSIRLRIDGVLREVLSLPARMTPVLTSRVKVMARLDIAEKRVPQDGRISIALGAKTVDVRVSTLPARFGERVVMRLLDKDQARLDLNALGIAPKTLDQFKSVLQKPNGIILVTGPTGSGKTTTLYAALSLLNDPSRNILTVEDPVEYALDGIGQTQVNPKVGMSFATGLRAILRQDPDIVMVGEVRDVETAEIAVQASLTGHLVLSTVHTNSAVGAITRLKDMGIETFLLSSTVAAVMAQRLVRRLCQSCKEPYALSTAEKKMMGMDARLKSEVYKPSGCGRCNHTGYEGRLGLYELLIVDDRLKALIHEEASESELSSYAFAQNDNLAQSGFAHVLSGETSLEEVMRVVQLQSVSEA